MKISLVNIIKPSLIAYFIGGKNCPKETCFKDNKIGGQN